MNLARDLLKKIMKTNFHFHRLYWFLVIVLGLISLTSYSKSVPTDSSSKYIYAELIQAQSNKEVSIDFAPTGQPNKQTPGGSRGSCEGINAKELTALVPKKDGSTSSENSILRNVLTISEYPTFWIYIPDQSENIQYAELVLNNETQKKQIARISYELQETPGIVSVTIPSKPEYSLETDTIYRWYFTVICDNNKTDILNISDILHVGGFLQRVTIDLAEHNYIWYDVLNDLAEQRRLEPHDLNLQEDWNKLMNEKEVGLLDELPEEFKFGSVVPKE